MENCFPMSPFGMVENESPYVPWDYSTVSVNFCHFK